MSDPAQPLLNQPAQMTIDQLGKDLDLFTERARSSLAHANREARAFNHNYIGTEHLLIGLLNVEDGVASRALANLGVPTEKVREAAWLIHAGIEGNRELFERVQATVADIRRLRQQVQMVAWEMGAGQHPQPVAPAAPGDRE